MTDNSNSLVQKISWNTCQLPFPSIASNSHPPTQMVGLYLDPHGETISVMSDTTQQNIQLASDKDTIASLRRRVQELESEVCVHTVM